MSAVVQFKPTAVEAAVAVVRKQHVQQAAGPLEPPTSVVEWLRRELGVTPISALAELAHRLSPAQLRAGLYLLDHLKLAEKADLLLQARPRKDLMRVGWRYLLYHYPVPRLEKIITLWAKRLSWDPLATERLPAQTIAKWLGDSDLAHGIMEHWENDYQHASLLPEEWLARFDLDRHDSLTSHMWRNVLSAASGSTLSSLPAGELIRRARSDTYGTQEAFATHYLHELGSRQRWNEDVLVWIAEVFREPKAGEIQTPFWHGIRTLQRREFLAWVRLRTLRRFLEEFHDPHGRFDFWKPFVESAVPGVELRCRDRWHGRRIAICLRFDGFGVIEFGPIGNAAYFYPPRVFDDLVKHESPNPGLYKNLQETLPVGHGGDGRIIHGKGWQETNRPWVSQLIRQNRRSGR